MNKKSLEYDEKYGHVPKDYYDRLRYVIKMLKLGLKEVRQITDAIRMILKNNTWKDIDFIFYIMPEASPRPRYSSKMGRFYVKNAQDDHIFFKECLENTPEAYEMITTLCHFYCDYYMPIPDNMNKIEKILSELRLLAPPSTPDWDNVGKKYSDMVQKELILNDSLITQGFVRRYYSFKPRVEIFISYMSAYDCKYNKRKIESWKSYKDRPELREKDSII